MQVGDLVEDVQFGDLGVIVSMRFGSSREILYGVYFVRSSLSLFQKEGVIEVYERWLTLRSRHESR